ncbi:MAG: M23 family metallopeptidase [Microcoleaceae cyanobacterium]
MMLTQRQLTKLFKIIAIPLLAIATLLITLSLPALSQTVNSPTLDISPKQPILGDTITVLIDNPSQTPPTVTMAGQTYQMFNIGNNRYRALIPTTPLDSPGEKPLQVKAGDNVTNTKITLGDRSFPTQSIWLSPERNALEGTDMEFDRVDAFKALVTSQKYWQGPFIRPHAGEVTTVYGVRRYYNGEFAEDYFHRGVDYAGDYNSPVIAPAAGRVSLVGYESEGFEIHGNIIGIDHGQGVTSLFLHLNRIDVREGDMVKAGQVIGGVGDTGASAGPHLHWGLYIYGKSVDPVPWRQQTVP